MLRPLRIACALVALALVPVSLYLALTVPTAPIPPQWVLWAPFGVLVLDALLFAFALGIWQVTAWERVGLSIILPLLIAMASWAALMDNVAARLPPAG